MSCELLMIAAFTPAADIFVRLGNYGTNKK